LLDPLPTGLDALWGPVWLAEIYREWALLLVGTSPALAVEKYTTAIEIIDRVLAREPQLLRGRVVQSQLYTYRSMAYQSLGKQREQLQDLERSVAFADGVHHYICQIGYGIGLAHAGDYRRAVAESKAAALCQDLPLCWRVEIARSYAIAAGSVERDISVPLEERDHRKKEFVRLVLAELKRCDRQGHFVDGKNRWFLVDVPGFEALRSEPEYKNFLEKIESKTRQTSATAAPAARVPGDSK
jgi:hypothetical protein